MKSVCRKEKPFPVDHDHKTGVARGLLCRRRNTALGALGNDAEGLKSALDDLR